MKYSRVRPAFSLLVLLFLLLVACGVSRAQEPPPEPLPPAAPSEVVVSGIEETRATVAWSPVPTATQYTVWVNGRRWAGSTGPAAELRGLQPYNDYSVYVTAANDAGESGPSVSVNFKTLPPAPTAPQKPEVSEVTDSSALVTWQPLPSWQHIQFYRIYVDGKAVADVTPQEGLQRARLTNLDPGTHAVAVAGVNENREGPPSEPAPFEVRSIPAPAGLALANRSADSIWIVWEPVPGAQEYRLYLNGQPVGETSGTSYRLSGLQAETAYEVGVAAAFPDGNVSGRATLQVQTLPPPERLDLAALTGAGYRYFPDVLPGLVAVFVVGGAFLLARLGQYSIAQRLRALLR